MNETTKTESSQIVRCISCKHFSGCGPGEGQTAYKGEGRCAFDPSWYSICFEDDYSCGDFESGND